MNRATHLRRALFACMLVARAAVSPALGQDVGACPPPAPTAPPTAQQVQEGLAQARDRGFLWRLTKGDHSSYLYGTIHMARLEWAFPGPKTIKALREIDTVALEVDPLDSKTRQVLSSGMRGAPAPVVELPPALKERIERRMAVECVPPETFQKLAPEVQVMALTFLAGRREGLELAYGIDGVLAGFGRAAKKRIVALETTDSQLRAGRAMTGGGTLALEKALDELESGRAAANLARFATLWAEADLAQIQQFDSTAAASGSETGRLLSAQILDDRNRGMAMGIDALHSAGSKVFAAVGFLHMVGPLGLPSLMSEKGYQVEAIKLTP